MPVEKNMEKYEIYKAMKSNLKRALRAGFYYEAIFIEYAIIEDRCVSMIKHAGLKYVESDGKEISINKKLNKFKTCAPFTSKEISKRLDCAFLQSVSDWKDERNTLIHHLATTPYDAEEVKSLAIRGDEIVRKLSSKAESVNRLIDKQLIK